MKNSNLNNEYLDDEIDLIELLRTIYSSKKLIILITLTSALLAFIYVAQKESVYQSTITLEIGSYDLINGEKKLVEPVSTSIKKLKINQISKQLVGLNFNSIEDHFLEINYTSPSLEFNENLINEAIIFVQESHVETLDSIVNSFSEKIATIDSEVEFIKNSIKNQQESKKLIAINAIKTIDSKIPALKSKIKFLLELIPAEEENLLLLKSDPSALLQRAASSPTLQQIIYSYNEQTITLKNQVQNLQQEKDTLELQVKFIAEGEFTSEELFKLQQEKDTLELQVKLVKDQASSTKPIRELVTSKIKPKQLLTILIGTILGFIFSVLIVLIRQAFLKEQN
ncbi:Wzz/FepE/Etk N-terminal domain-containing protein [Candidatus Thioglobus sp.]|nr:Wzz/FepE/Etk N-terminal domain-containing protein [Candidatus Thioglobus sp.]